MPPPLQSLIDGYSWEHIPTGYSAAATYRLTRSGRPTMFLKVCPPGALEGLDDEKARLEWLQGRLPVPRLLGYGEEVGGQYLLTSALPGLAASDITAQQGPTEALVALLAQVLRLIHAVPIDNCPFDMTLDRAIERARYRTAYGLVDESDFDPERRGKTAADLLETLLRTRPSDEDLVFTHGDYCLPNVIVRGDALSGFVDLGRAGVADRYQDIALAARSIRRNCGPGYEGVFFEAYGLERPDWAKIEYYKLLDEF
ncbi:MAG: aminoglycoside 3'-phosphotransferase [Chloroflexi bacterium]|nr:aminoglycoside 3'-phosphotransferase [Chloroflexota bacterium]